MEQNIENMVAEFIASVENYAKEKGKQVRNIKQRRTKKDDGYRAISSIIDYETYKVRFAYQINEGAIFKKGVVTLYFNIGEYEYHFCDVLASIAPRDKDCVVFPYVDEVETMHRCIQFLCNKLDKYADKIVELSVNEEKKKSLENVLKKEIKYFSGKDIVKEGPLSLMISGIYSNTAIIRYTSEPYEAFLNGNYKKAIKLYNKEGTLTKYEKQLVRYMKYLIKKNIVKEIPEDQKTINRKKQVIKESFIYTVLSFLILLPITFVLSYTLLEIFNMVISKNALMLITIDNLFLLIPVICLSLVFTIPFRDVLFGKKISNTIKFKALHITNFKLKKMKKLVNLVTFCTILSIAILSAISVTLREEGIKYSTNIFDVKGSIVPYSDIVKVDVEDKKIELKNSEFIYLDWYDVDMQELQESIQNIIKRK